DNLDGVNLEEWLRDFLSSRMSGERVDRVVSRIPGYLLRGDFSAVLADGNDYESAEGLRLLVSEIGRSLLQEGEEGAAAISDLLRWMESGGGVRALVAQWYRMIVRVGRGIEV
ncbi:MAG: hypothetical protein ACP5NG_05130, partial [Conexivisphaera sp.]